MAHLDTNGNSETTPSGVERVFISPRVIDQTAFDECAGQLRDILEAADAKTSELRAATTEAQAMRQAIAEQQARQRSQLELVSKLLKAMTAKSEQVNTTLEHIDTKAKSIDELEARAKAILDQIAHRGASGHTTAAPSHHPTNLAASLAQGEAMRTEIELSIKRLSMLRDDARAAARELAITLGNVLEAMEEIPEQPLPSNATDPIGSAGDRHTRAALEADAERFRKEVASDLSKMAAAMRLIANRAETHVRTALESGEPTEINIRVRDTQPSHDTKNNSPVSPGTPLS